MAKPIKGDAGGNDLTGTEGDDVIDGGGVPMKNGVPTYAAQDNIFGLGGDDDITLTGLGFVDGGDGEDTITATGEGYIKGGLGNDKIYAKTLGFDGEYDYVGVQFDEAYEGIVANFTSKKFAGVAGGSNQKGYSISDGQGGTDKVFGIHGVEDTKFGDTFIIDGSVNNSYGGDISVNLGAGNDYVRVVGTGKVSINYGKAQGGVKIDLEEHEATDIDDEDNFIGYDRLVGEFTHTRGTKFADSIAGAGNDESIRGRIGSDSIWGRGGNDKIWGDEKENKQGDGSDTIYGGAGNDWLRGGGGKDTFVFDTKLNGKSNVDTIDDFNVKDDTFKLDGDFFAVGKAGKLNADLFADTAKEIDKDTRIIYDTKSGALSYDADGSGKKYDAVKFAVIDNDAKLTEADFIVI